MRGDPVEPPFGCKPLTATQFQEMSDRDLVSFARSTKATAYPGLLLLELANRLDDRYPFSTAPETTGFIQEV